MKTQSRVSTARHASVLAMALIGALAWPDSIHAQTPGSAPAETPPGWFGVTINDQVMLDERGNAFFDSYPVVSQVEPGSPAARAGVVAGDVLISFNSRDMRGESLQLSRWLRPGAPFVLRLRRNDAIRVVRGTLARRPDNWEKRTVVELSMPERFEMRTSSPAREPTSGGVMRVRMPAPPPSSVLLPALGFGGGHYPFAGAEFTALNDDLSDVLGVKPEGVFVTNVADGSPARMSGLRGGDIIVRADSIKVETPIDLVRAIRGARPDRTISLEIIRKNKPQTVTLRW